MEDIYPKALELLDKGRFSVLATIIGLTGSGPRGVGTKFIIMEDGSYEGTIGGGLLEAQVLKGAKQVFATRKPARLGFNLRGTDVAKTDMLCGGQTQVFLEPLFPERMDQRQLFNRAVEIQKQGGSGILVTLVDVARWKEGEIPKLFLESDGERIGAVSGLEEIENKIRNDMTDLLRGRQSALISYHDSRGQVWEVFVEPIVSEPMLYVFGGGHVSSQIVPLANRVGFKVAVIDDRPEFADPKKFPDAAEVHQYPFEGVMQRLPVSEASYFVIVTRGHIHDKSVLNQCLKTNAKYIGMIGSRRKIAMVYDSLKEEGFTQKDIDRVYAPIGLDIGAETPEEIAVSIVAELISVRAGRGIGVKPSFKEERQREQKSPA
jgi:xanthine dehydrogenase accessory factor